MQTKVIELVEKLLLSRFPQFDQEAIRMKFKLHDIRESKVWQEATQEGIEEGKRIVKAEMIQKCLAKAMSLEQIAELMDIPLEEVRALAQPHSS